MADAVLLTQASRQDMLEMVGITVARLQKAPMQPRHSGPAAPKLLQSPQQDAAARDAHGAPGLQAAAQNGSSPVALSADGEETETGAWRLICYHLTLQTAWALLPSCSSVLLAGGDLTPWLSEVVCIHSAVQSVLCA